MDGALCTNNNGKNFSRICFKKTVKSTQIKASKIRLNEAEARMDEVNMATKVELIKSTKQKAMEEKLRFGRTV